MDRLRLLMLATYPSDIPLHGGQRRVHAIAESFIDAGWEVRHFSAFPQGSYSTSAASSDHVLIPRDFINRIIASRQRADLHASLYFSENPEAQARLAESIIRYRPHAVTLEQPWLFPVLRNLVDSASQSFLLINSTQNVEHELMAAILRQENHPRIEEWVAATAQLEQLVSSAADLTICVTERDADHFRAMGARSITIAPNGAARRPATVVSTWHATLAGRPYAFMTGSAHPPNCTGFLDLLGAQFAFLPRKGKLVVAGGMASLLARSRDFQVNQDLVARRVVLVPQPTEADLDHLINQANVVILPIRQGGGSNIKTAEALLSDRPIIGTTTAFRGYEEFLTAPGVRVADDSGRYQHLVRQALEKNERVSFSRPASERLLWKNCVGHLPAVVRSLLQS